MIGDGARGKEGNRAMRPGGDGGEAGMPSACGVAKEERGERVVWWWW